MRSVFGSTLINLGLLMAMGCALPDRTTSSSADFGFRRKESANSKTAREPSTGNIALKAPRRNRTSDEEPESRSTDWDQQLGRTSVAATGNSASSIEMAPGHSSLGSTQSNSESPSSAKASSKMANSTIDRSSSEQVKHAAAFEDEKAGPFDASRRGVIQVHDRVSGDKAASPIQLQGLEFDPTWTPDQGSATRTSVRENLPAKGSLVDSPVAKTQKTQSDPQIPSWSQRPTVSQTAVSAEPMAIPKTTAQLPLLPWQGDLEQLIARVEQNLAQSKPESKSERQNEYLRKQAHLRLLYLMAQRQEEALTAIPGIDPSQQEYWQQLIWAMSNSFDTIQFPDSNERASQAVPPLNAALRLMREEAGLSIKNMAFCRKISYFGNYERFPRNEFTPGYEVLLYTEIENFVSTPTVDGEYRTSLKSQIEMTDPSGKVVWTKGFPPTEDFCRNPRRDYFHNYQFHIPEDLPTGTYTLKLTIVDELSHKRVSNSLNFVLK